MIVLFNGTVISPHDPIISATSESFTFGFGVFETLRTYNKVIFKSKEHIERLFRSASLIGFPITVSKKDILDDLEQVVNQSSYSNQRIKITLIKEGIIVTSQELITEPDLEKGVSLLPVIQKRAFSSAKTLAYLDSYVSHQRAQKEGYYDALLTDEEQFVYEGAYSNIFWFEEESLYTRKENVLKGITADIVLNISLFKTGFKTIHLSEILKKDEIFLTQTSAGILPVTQIDNHTIGDGKVGQKTKKIMNEFANYVKNYK